jgi:Ser/Thr protein kinase RdoA (MazF antagonist)
MSSKIHPNDTLFRKVDFERSYGFEITKFERVIAGHTNLIYKLHLENSYPIIARITEVRSPRELEYEAKFHEFLNDNNINCPKLIGFGYIHNLQSSRTGKEYPSILMEYIEGNHPDTLNDLFYAGRELAKLHQLAAPSFSNKSAGLNLDHLRSFQWPRVFVGHHPVSNIKVILKEVESVIYNLPKGICHGDFFRINTLVNDRQCYLLDFESMGEDSTVMDLGKALFGMVTPRTDYIDREMVNQFLEGYCEVKSLKLNEMNVLPMIAAVAGVQVAYWRYNYWRNNPNHYDINEDLWKDALKTSRAWLNFSL